MKFLHLSDLHLGIRLHELSLLDDQRFMLEGILNVCDTEKVDAVLICGDIYDKPIPPAEAIQLFDDFITKLSDRDITVLITSGNHDSAERLSFGNAIMSSKGVYISPVYSGELTKVSIKDCDIWMLPFIKPANVRRYFDDKQIEDYTDAVKAALSVANIDKSKYNILMCHQFVTDSSKGESVVGGLDNVDVSAFDDFDYVAMGHIHESYSVGRKLARYCGTLLCYDFRFCDLPRGVDVVVVENGVTTVNKIPFKPLHDMINLRGELADLTDPSKADKGYRDAYLHITLTDEDEAVDAVGRLRSLYPNMLCLDYDNTRTRAQGFVLSGGETDEKSPFELFSEFFELRNGSPMSEEQEKEIAEIMNDVWGDYE